MQPCPSCSIENIDSSKFCSECGIALRPEYAQTVTSGKQAEENEIQSSLSENSHHGRFLPGTKVANRYRIVSLVGKGGMGEVYRADDLKLGHTVALKFLPKDLADDPRRLEYFHNEVRLARQISHPNVCRVYDIGEIDGQHFLSMEYIDGEDLKILLRRIGRLPKDKGTEIAQQLCAGLAAAHERGVLHRDLKPANIMLDGRGQVRITDFGLAKLADDGVKGEIAGTPAYMAPEQLARGEASIQSDLYSLGLILYELFTGKAVHKTGSVPELMRAHEESSLSQPSSLVEDMDPAMERVILRCLSKEPRERPTSAHAVAAAFPGGDPLAAAIAAGETPSPEMVAAAGKTGTLPMRKGVFCLAAVLVALVALMYLSPSMQPSIAPNALDPVRLRIAAQDDILAPLGYFDANAKPTVAVHGLQLRKQPDGRQDWEFWYRQRSGSFLTPTISEITNGPRTYTISMSNPPPFGAGMVSVRTDLQGNLIELLAVPEGGTSTNTNNSLDALFGLAGLSLSNFEKIDQAGELPANWTPPVYCDDAVVYRSKSGDLSTRVIVARKHDQLVYFYAGQLMNGRFVDRQFGSLGDSLSSKERPLGYRHLLQLIVLLASIFLTLRNVRLGRADRKGALRFAVWLGGLQILVWVFGLHHVSDPLREWLLLREFLRVPWLAYFFRHWLYYMALEPYIRRYWPEVLIAWSRAIDGRFRDPLLGQQLLIGCLTGVLTWLICSAVYVILADMSGIRAPFLVVFDVNSPVRLTATLLHELSRCASNAVFVLMLMFLLRTLLRDTRMVVAGYVLLNVTISGLDGFPVLALAVVAIWSAGVGLTISRFGLIAGVAFIFAQKMLEVFPITPDVTSWYRGGTLVALGSITAVAVYGFYTSTLAGRSLFGDSPSAKRIPPVRRLG